jgi:hypothetical protein
MRLWSIQSEEIYELLKQNKTFWCDINKSEIASEDDFKKAYNWMKNKMTKILDIEKDVYPIWAWYKYNGKNKQPDLRTSGYAQRGSKCVCLEIEIPDERVLLSDFDLWHIVLMDTFYCKNEKDEEWFENLCREQKLIEKEKSWDRIFNISNSDFVQATFFELKIEDVKKVKYFIAR